MLALSGNRKPKSNKRCLNTKCKTRARMHHFTILRVRIGGKNWWDLCNVLPIICLLPEIAFVVSPLDKSSRVVFYITDERSSFKTSRRVFCTGILL